VSILLLLLDNRTTFVSSLILALARFNLLLDREFLYSNFLDDSVQQFLLRPLRTLRLMGLLIIKAQHHTRVSHSGWPIQTFCSTVYFLCHYEKVKYPWCLIISLKDEIKRQGILLCSLQLLLSTTVAAHHTVNNHLL
jgi:hypothetical protein